MKLAMWALPASAIAIAILFIPQVLNVQSLFADVDSTSVDLGFWTLVGLAFVIAASGFVSGLSGFGFSAIGAFTLWLLPPMKAIPLLMALSTVNQLMSMHELRSQFDIQEFTSSTGSIPYIIGGIIGIPAGLWVLTSLDAAIVSALFGAILISYSLWTMVKPVQLIKFKQSPLRSAFIGGLGGVIGGFTAFPGCVVVIWSGLVGKDKAEQRTVVQPFILSIQLISLISLAAYSPEKFDLEFFILFLPLVAIALPFTKFGVAVFHRISDANFKQATQGLLLVSGVALLAKLKPLILVW